LSLKYTGRGKMIYLMFSKRITEKPKPDLFRKVIRIDEAQLDLSPVPLTWPRRRNA
jgi:hypothetical protein